MLGRNIQRSSETMTQVIPIIVRRNNKTPLRKPMLQITIPIAIRRQYNIQHHDTLLMVANEKEIKLYTKDEYMKRLSD